MIKSSVISTSMLNEDKRLDPEYFQPQFIELNNILQSNNTISLNKIAIVSDGNHNSVAENYAEKGIQYIRGKDVQNGFVDKSELVTISESAYNSMKRAHLQENDILLSIVGTIGNVALIKNKKDHIACSCKLAIIRKSKINVDFLYAFLLSKYGQFQIKRMIRGALQQGLILPDLKKTPNIKTT